MGTSHLLEKVASLYQILDLVLKLGALLYGVPNVFVIRTVFVLIGVRSVSKWVRAVHERLIGDDVQDLLLTGR